MIALGVAALALAALRFQAFSFFSYDDMYIMLRYIANFLQHGVLQWNLNEPPVEGFTNLLHMGFIIPLGALGVDLVDATRGVNAVCVLLCAVTLYAVFYKRLGVWLAALPAVLMLANSSMLAWIWGGLEVPLTVLVLLIAQALMLHVLEKPEARTPRMAALTGFVFALAMLNRLDTALFAGVAAFVWLGMGGKKRLLLTSIFSAVFLAFVGMNEFWRITTFHEFLPNTYYAKVAGAVAASLQNGFTYLFDGLTEPPWFYACGIAPLVYLATLKTYRAFAVYALASMAISAAYIVHVGGDFMPGYRFLMPWLPFVYLAFGLGIESIAPVSRDKTALIASAFLLLALVPLPKNLQKIDVSGPMGLQVARYIAKDWPKGSLIALNAAGAIPYVNRDKNFIDMLGLNDRTIAHRVMPDVGASWQKKVGHSKGDGAYVLSRKPDYIIMGSVAGDALPDTPVFASDVELKASAEFRRCYKHNIQNLEWPPELVARNGPIATPFFLSYYKRVCRKD